MRSSPSTPDLFAGDDAPAETADIGLSDSEARGEPVPAENEGRGSDARDKTSIEAFAQRQRDIYQAGVDSASAWWKAKGVTWPRS